MWEGRVKGGWNHPPGVGSSSQRFLSNDLKSHRPVGSLDPLQGSRVRSRPTCHHVGSPFWTQTPGSDSFTCTVVCPWWEQHPVYKHLNIFLLPLTPLKAGKDSNILPKIWKRTLRVKEEGNLPLVPQLDRKESDRPHIGSPTAARRELWAKWRAGQSYGRHLPQVIIFEHDWAGLAALGVSSHREGSAKELPPCRGHTPGCGHTVLSWGLVAAPAATAPPALALWSPPLLHSLN